MVVQDGPKIKFQTHVHIFTKYIDGFSRFIFHKVVQLRYI